MTIDKIHDFIRDLLEREQRGWHAPEQIDTALDRSQLSVFNDYHAQYATSQEAQDALSPFKKSLPFATDSTGAYAIPLSENYQNLLGAGIVVAIAGRGNETRSIRFVDEDERDDRLRSQLLKPSLLSPIGEFTGLGAIKLYPDAAYAGTVRFLRRPQAPKYAYTISGRAVTYDSAGSKQLEWAERYQNTIILKSLEYLGLNIGNPQMVEIAATLAKANG